MIDQVAPDLFACPNIRACRNCQVKRTQIAAASEYNSGRAFQAGHGLDIHVGGCPGQEVFCICEEEQATVAVIVLLRHIGDALRWDGPCGELEPPTGIGLLPLMSNARAAFR